MQRGVDVSQDTASQETVVAEVDVDPSDNTLQVDSDDDVNELLMNSLYNSESLLIGASAASPGLPTSSGTASPASITSSQTVSPAVSRDASPAPAAGSSKSSPAQTAKRKGLPVSHSSSPGLCKTPSKRRKIQPLPTEQQTRAVDTLLRLADGAEGPTNPQELIQTTLNNFMKCSLVGLTDERQLMRYSLEVMQAIDEIRKKY